MLGEYAALDETTPFTFKSQIDAGRVSIIEAVAA